MDRLIDLTSVKDWPISRNPALKRSSFAGLEIAPLKDKAGEIWAIADAMTGQKKIVVVEDDRHQLKALSEFLERTGYSVLGVQNGQER